MEQQEANHLHETLGAKAFQAINLCIFYCGKEDLLLQLHNSFFQNGSMFTSLKF